MKRKICVRSMALRVSALAVVIWQCLITAACSHNHEMPTHDHTHQHDIPHHDHEHSHEVLPHTHQGIAGDTNADIVRISDRPYTPDRPADDNTASICSGKVLIVFSQVPLNTEASAWVTAYYADGQEIDSWDRLSADNWWEQDRETVTIYFDWRYRQSVDHYKVEGLIGWHSGRKHFDVTIVK